MTLDLEAIEQRAKAATEGPREIHREQNRRAFAENLIEAHGARRTIGLTLVAPGDGDFSKAEVDAEFIAHARSDVPALVSEVRRLREELEVQANENAKAWATAQMHADNAIERAAENRLLRVALRRIGFEPIGPAEATADHVLNEVTMIARAALKGDSRG